jgi:hypothetical protein
MPLNEEIIDSNPPKFNEDDYQRMPLNEEIIDSNPSIFNENVIISIQNLSKKFGDFDAVKDLTL